MRFLVALLMSFAVSAGNADVLFQVVSLDCKFCAQFSESGGEQRIIDFAEQNGVATKVGAFGPVIELSNVLPENPVLAYWASVRLDPSKAHKYTEVLYQAYSSSRTNSERINRGELLDLLAIAGGLDKDKLDNEARTNVKQHLRMWSQTAKIASLGMEYGNADQLNTPAFVYLDENGVAGYVDWKGSADKTVSAVKTMIQNLGVNK